MGTSQMIWATMVFAALLAGFWVEVRGAGIAKSVGGHLPSAFLCFALLLSVLWFFAFGAAERIVGLLHSRAARLAASAFLGVPYLIFAIPRGEFQWMYALVLAGLPVAISATFEFSHLEQKLAWQDVVVLATLAAILELRLLSGAWPYRGLGAVPKLYLADVALYAYLVIRRLGGVGYSFVPKASAFGIGIREYLFFAPLGIGLGLALHFIHFYPRVHSIGHIVLGVLVTFLLTAVPEELFFRGILQNLLEPRAGRFRALMITSALFGLSHFHKGAAFNWRYVLLATIAGIFYGRAWRNRRQLLASSVTHSAVDVTWSLWFR